MPGREGNREGRAERKEGRKMKAKETKKWREIDEGEIAKK